MQIKFKRIFLITGIFILILIGSIYFFYSQNNFLHRSDKHLTQLLEQACLNMQSNTDKAFSQANEVLQLSLKDKKIKYTIQSLQVCAQLYDLKGKPNEALGLYLKADSLSIKNQYLNDHCSIQLYIGKLLYKWGQYDSSLWYFNQCLILC